MKANAPQIKTTKFENNPKPGMQARYDDLHDRAWTSRLTPAEHEEMQELEQKLEDTPKTKFDEHVLPGAQSNYREMTLSHSNPTGDDYIVPAAHGYKDNDADINRILHMRMNDRNISHPAFTANRHPSTKALNIEELQSDWAQQGRSRGFKGDNTYNPDKGLPKGPYVQNTEDWTKLGLHNAIKEAAEQGHHAVTWTNGDEQAKRWGNEGLKHYYDTVMPSVSNDILKKMGVAERVGEFDVGTGVPHQGFNITPEMLDYIVSNGLPRFKSGGAVHMKDGGTPFNDSPHKGMSHTTPARGMTEDELRNTMKPYEYEAPLDEPLISPDMAIGTGLPTAIAKLLGKGVMGAGKALAPVGNQFLEDYMARQGMTLSAAPTKRGVVSSLNDNANTASAAKYKPAGVMNSAEKPEPMLASKAYNEIMGETVSPTSVADRMIVRPGTSKEKGGSMFPWLSTVDPNYDGMVWANKGAGAASRMINTAKESEGVIFTPQIGSPEMHRSNQVVYEKILRAFDRAKAEGKLTPELMRAYNDRLKSFYENDKGGQLFQPNFDIGATNLRKEATTFPHRAAIAEVLGGKGLRAYGYKNREAAQIVPYNKILQSTTEPQSLGAEAGSVGPRFFQLSGERSYRPDLHSAFPEMVGGTDLGIQYPHTARDVVFTDFIKKIEASKGRPPGHMDWDKNRVLQKVRPETVYRLEDMGLKAGGAVHMSEGGDTKTGGKFSHEALLAKTKADEPIHEQVQRYLDMMKVDAAGGRDVYGTNLYGMAKMDIPVGKATVSPYLEGSAYRPAGQTFSGQLTGAGVNVTLPFKQGGDVGVSRDTMMIELMNKGKR
jgi:hypothetical protein